MRKKTLALLCLILAAQLVSGCAFPPNAGAPAPQPAEKMSAWAVYWDADDAIAQITDLDGQLESFEYFGAYFDAQNRLFIPEEIAQLRGKVKQVYGEDSPWPDYLTFINDKLLAEGGSSLKDTELLYALLAKPTVRQTHIQEILDLTESGGYDGVEIDYEAIRKDMVLWQHFIDFITELSSETAQRGLLLRVVLEPGIPYEALSFPKGPEYVIMCYNLHGPGSEPGPKADDAFLLELVKKTTGLPGRRNFAIATGGFDWAGNVVTALSQKEAHALARQKNVDQHRDVGSQALSFSYSRDDIVHQVWYADSITLEHWANLLRSSGDFGISLWRL
ncbi:glycosyl hydrolase family 18 protein [Oscillospiraceae bacterium LTW-04]|nr:glycosyl hydrolase family 18 protein [Oscillospiraceae bacterium MB24-C1]